MRHLPKHTLPSREVSDSSAPQFRQLLNGRLVDRLYLTPSEFTAFNFGSVALPGEIVSLSADGMETLLVNAIHSQLCLSRYVTNGSGGRVLEERKCSDKHYLTE